METEDWRGQEEWGRGTAERWKGSWEAQTNQLARSAQTGERLVRAWRAEREKKHEQSEMLWSTARVMEVSRL